MFRRSLRKVRAAVITHIIGTDYTVTVSTVSQSYAVFPAVSAVPLQILLHRIRFSSDDILIQDASL
jgi:hypothetical protein